MSSQRRLGRDSQNELISRNEDRNQYRYTGTDVHTTNDSYDKSSQFSFENRSMASEKILSDEDEFMSGCDETSVDSYSDRLAKMEKEVNSILMGNSSDGSLGGFTDEWMKTYSRDLSIDSSNDGDSHSSDEGKAVHEISTSKLQDEYLYGNDEEEEEMLVRTESWADKEIFDIKTHDNSALVEEMLAQWREQDDQPTPKRGVGSGNAAAGFTFDFDDKHHHKREEHRAKGEISSSFEHSHDGSLRQLQIDHIIESESFQSSTVSPTRANSTESSTTFFDADEDGSLYSFNSYLQATKDVSQSYSSDRSDKSPYDDVSALLRMSENATSFGNTKHHNILSREAHSATTANIRAMMLQSRAVTIQKHARRMLASLFFVKNIRAAIQIQCKVRCIQANRDFLERKILRHKTIRATLIQTSFRRFTAARRYQRARELVITIQACMRMAQAKQLLHAAQMSHYASTLIQANFRKFLALTKFKFTRIRVIQIQSSFRRMQCMEAFEFIRDCAVLIQTVVRMRQATDHFLILKTSAVFVQKNYRMMIAAKRFTAGREAVVRIQSMHRTNQTAKQYSLLKASAICIQKNIKRTLAAQRFAALRVATIRIQSMYRMTLAADNFCFFKASAICIQTNFRTAMAVQKFEEVRDAAILIQSKYRMIQAADQFFLFKASIICIQKNFRRTLAVQQFAEIKDAVVRIQSMHRMRKALQHFSSCRDSAIFIQKNFQRNVAVQQFTAIRNAAVRIQSMCRMTQAADRFFSFRMSSLSIQKNFRKALAVKKYAAIRGATVQIQSMRRMTCALKYFLSFKTSAIAVQKSWKMSLEVRRFAAIRNAAVRIQSMLRMLQAADHFFLLKVSAVCVQKNLKRKLAMNKFAAIRDATIRIQSVHRMNQGLKLLSVSKCSVICIQKNYRRSLAIQKFVAIRNASIRIQSVHRKIQALQHYSSCRDSAICIQKNYKMKLAAQKFVVSRSAAVRIQCWNRKAQARQRFSSLKDSALCIQKNYRRTLAMSKFAAIRNAAVRIQSWNRKIRALQRFSSFRDSAVCIQKNYRRTLATSKFAAVRNAAVRIQSWNRKTHALQFFYSLKASILCIQMNYRRTLAARKFAAIRNAAITVQSWYRKTQALQHYILLRNSAVCIQNNYRKTLATERLTAIRNAAVVIQSVYRMTRATQHFRVFKASTICIQKNYRRMLVVQKSAAIRNAVVRIQSIYRMVQPRNHFSVFKASAIRVQKIFRTSIAVRKFTTIRDAALRIQSMHRRTKLHALQNKENTIRCLQATWKCFNIRRKYLNFLHSVLTVQTCLRRWLAQTAYATVLRATICIQARMRSWLAAQSCLKLKSESPVQHIQSKCRPPDPIEVVQGIEMGAMVQEESKKLWQTATIVQCYERRRQAGNKFNFLHSVLTVQTCLRRWLARTAYATARRATICIQSRMRSWLAAQSYLKLKSESSVHHIQSKWDRVRGRTEVNRSPDPIEVVQGIAMGAMVQVESKQRWQAATIVQRYERRRQAWNKFKMETAIRSRQLSLRAVTIQSCYRRFRTLRRYERTQALLETIQTYLGMVQAKQVEARNSWYASMVIQMYWRKFLELQKFQLARSSAIVIQRLFRKHRCMTKDQRFSNEHTAKIIRVQEPTSFSSAEANFEVQEEGQLRWHAATVVQCYERRRQAENKFKMEAEIRSRQLSLRAITIQSCCRRFITLRRYQHTQALLETIQTYLGMVQTKQIEARNSWYASMVIQMNWRKFLKLRNFQLVRRSAIVVQGHVRKKQCMKKKLQQISSESIPRKIPLIEASAIRIQKNHRKMMAVHRFEATKKAVERIQSIHRRSSAVKNFQEIKCKVVLLQATWKCFSKRRKYATLLDSVLVIQAFYRRWSTRCACASPLKAIVFIQSRVRSWLAVRRYSTLISAVIRIQSIWRGILGKLRFEGLRIQIRLMQGLERVMTAQSDAQRWDAAVTIQAFVRMRLARKVLLEKISKSENNKDTCSSRKPTAGTKNSSSSFDTGSYYTSMASTSNMQLEDQTPSLFSRMFSFWGRGEETTKRGKNTAVRSSSSSIDLIDTFYHYMSCSQQEDVQNNIDDSRHGKGLGAGDSSKSMNYSVVEDSKVPDKTNMNDADRHEDDALAPHSTFEKGNHFSGKEEIGIRRKSRASFEKLSNSDNLGMCMSPDLFTQFGPLNYGEIRAQAARYRWDSSYSSKRPRALKLSSQCSRPKLPSKQSQKHSKCKTSTVTLGRSPTQKTTTARRKQRRAEAPETKYYPNAIPTRKKQSSQD